MSVYYQIICDEKKERIDPGDINDLGIRFAAIAHPEHPFGPIAIFAMLTRWKSPARIVSDSDENSYHEYANVTKEVLDAYNNYYRTNHEFTGYMK